MTTEQEKFIAIGDIHGCAKTLSALLERLDEEFGNSRTYVFVGDYVDRGPDSKGVVEVLMKFDDTHHCVFLRGNHDAMLLNSSENGSWLSWYDNGGDATMESYGSGKSAADIPTDHLDFFMSTQLYFNTENWLFVHAGIPPHMKVEEAIKDKSTYNSFLWTRNHIYDAENVWEKTVVFGHTPVRQPITEKNMIGIDTGCVYEQYGKLTAVILPEVEFIQQKRIDF